MYCRSGEEDCIAIGFVLVELFLVVNRAKFFDRASPRPASQPNASHSFSSAQTESIYLESRTESIALESPDKQAVRRGGGKGRKSLPVLRARCGRHVNVPLALELVFVGFSPEETANPTIQMKLRRLLYPNKYCYKLLSRSSLP